MGSLLTGHIYLGALRVWLRRKKPAQSTPSCLSQSLSAHISTSKPGSLTQSIFRPDTCKCAEPLPIDKAISAPIHPAASNLEDDDEDELPLSQDKFPLNRYAPRAQLGTSGSGKVYLAKDRLLRKQVAVKLLHQLTNEQLILFQEEARATSKLTMYYLGYMYDNGFGEPRNVKEAIKWYQKAADGGVPEAIARLGILRKLEKQQKS